MVYKIYVVALFLIIFLSVWIKSVHRNKSRSFDLLSMRVLFLILFAIMGFRSVNVGVDTYNYSLIYQHISNASYKELISSGFEYDAIEIGYALLAKTCSLIIDNYYFFQLVVSAIFCSLFYIFIKENTSNYIISTLVFSAIGIYLASFNIVRQLLAVAFLINAWTQYRQSKYVVFVLFTTFAVFIHLSSISFIAAFLIYHYRNNKLFVRLYPFAVVAFVFFFSILIQYVAEYLTAYQNYYNNEREIQEANMVKILWMLESLISFFVLFKNDRFSGDQKFAAMMSLLYVSCNLIALSFNYFERIGLFFSPFLIILFDTFYLYIKRIKMINLANSIMYICFIIYFLLSTSSGQYVYSSFL